MHFVEQSKLIYFDELNDVFIDIQKKKNFRLKTDLVRRLVNLMIRVSLLKEQLLKYFVTKTISLSTVSL